MKNYHYDMKQVEAGIRSMFDKMPANDEVSRIIKEAVNVSVEMQKVILNEVMAQTNPEVLFEAVAGMFSNLIFNAGQSFEVDPEYANPVVPPTLQILTSNIADGVEYLYKRRLDKVPAAASTDISPVQSGNA